MVRMIGHHLLFIFSSLSIWDVSKVFFFFFSPFWLPSIFKFIQVPFGLQLLIKMVALNSLVSLPLQYLSSYVIMIFKISSFLTLVFTLSSFALIATSSTSVPRDKVDTSNGPFTGIATVFDVPDNYVWVFRYRFVRHVKLQLKFKQWFDRGECGEPVDNNLRTAVSCVY